MSESKKSNFGALFLVLFIDSMGLGILFPILTTILVDPASHFIRHQMSSSMRDFYYGFIVAIFMICWFFGAAFLGDLSDNIGRKKSLIICLLGAVVGYFISGLAIVYGSIFALILGRIIAGFTAGSQAIAQAAIVDLSEKEHLSRNMGLIILAICLGFVAGPIIGGVFSDSHLSTWFHYSTPMFIASLLSVINLIFLLYTFRESHVSNDSSRAPIKWYRAIEIFIQAFKNHDIRFLSIVLLIMMSAWSNYNTFVTLFLVKKYHYSLLQNSLFLSCLGLGFSIGSGILVDRLNNRFSLRNNTIVSLFMCGICCVITAVIYKQWMLWFAAFIIGMVMAIAYSTLLVMFSEKVSEDKQGWVMGVTGSVMALSYGLSTLFTGVVSHLVAGLPMVLAAILFFLSAVLLLLA